MLKILIHSVGNYPPNHTSGADIMAERLGTFLASKGCEVIAMVNIDQHTQYTYKGVTVKSYKRLLGEHYEWCDIVITHLVLKSEATMHGARFKKPVFHVVHNGYTSLLQSGTPDNYLIFNTHHLQQTARIELPSIVVQPPTWTSDWDYTDHYSAKYITLVNCVHNKGHVMFEGIAKQCPHRLFLGVYGGYGAQGRASIGNLHYKAYAAGSMGTMGNTSNSTTGTTGATGATGMTTANAGIGTTNSAMKEIYSQTRILLVPSISESWSLVAAEAQACGIPVICSDLPGIRENCGDTVQYAGTVRQYMDCLARLDSIDTYREYAERGYRYRVMMDAQHQQQLTQMFNFMEKVVYGDKVEKVEVVPAPEKVSRETEVEKQVTKPIAKKIINKPTTEQDE
jgi:glycosyltransferase involved in cell wall biosynthesis